MLQPRLRKNMNPSGNSVASSLSFWAGILFGWMCCVVLALLQEKLKVFLNFLQFKKKKEPEKVLLWGLELKSTLIDNHPTFFWVRAIFREIRVLFSDIL